MNSLIANQNSVIERSKDATECQNQNCSLYLSELNGKRIDLDSFNKIIEPKSSTTTKFNQLKSFQQNI